jgi:hypothetical protein
MIQRDTSNTLNPRSLQSESALNNASNTNDKTGAGVPPKRHGGPLPAEAPPIDKVGGGVSPVRRGGPLPAAVPPDKVGGEGK